MDFFFKKENKKKIFYLDQSWMLNGFPTLLVLVNGNKVFILQNDDLKKIVDIDTMNMNILDVNVE